MEHLQEYLADEPALGILHEEELLEAESQEHHEPEEHVEGSASTDDPVRVYLREMGSVRLLNRQGEIDLAKRMEHGKLRARKSLSRSPLVWRRAIWLHEQVRADEVRLQDAFEVGIQDDDAAERRVRNAINRQFG